MIEAGGVFVRGRLEPMKLTVRRGEIVALLGGDGAGKTSALDAITGVREPDSGPAEPQRGAYMTQKSSLFADMTVRANLKFTCDLEGLSHARSDERIRAAAARTGIEAVLDKPAQALSEGARRQACLTLALIQEEENLYLDEPTRDLESAEALRLRRVIASLREDHAILLATRSVTEAERLADRILLMNRGRVIAECEPGRLDGLARDAHTYRVRLAGSVEAVEGAERVEAKAAYTDAFFPCEDPAALLNSLAGRGLPILEFAPAPLDVDEFISAMDADMYAGEAEE